MFSVGQRVSGLQPGRKNTLSSHPSAEQRRKHSTSYFDGRHRGEDVSNHRPAYCFGMKLPEEGSELSREVVHVFFLLVVQQQ